MMPGRRYLYMYVLWTQPAMCLPVVSILRHMQVQTLLTAHTSG